MAMTAVGARLQLTDSLDLGVLVGPFHSFFPAGVARNHPGWRRLFHAALLDTLFTACTNAKVMRAAPFVAAPAKKCHRPIQRVRSAEVKKTGAIPLDSASSVGRWCVLDGPVR